MRLAPAFTRPTSLPWANAPGRELARLALPITVSTLSYAAMNLTSTMFVAHLGRDELAGVGLGAVVSFALICFAIGVLRGAKTLVSQALGAGRPELVDTYAGSAAAIAVTFGTLVAVLGVLLAPLVGHLCASPRAGEFASSFLALRMLSAPVVLLFAALREVSYGEGNAVAPMRASLAGNAANIALDALFIVGLDLGVSGAALATVVAQSVELAVLAVPVRRRLLALRPSRLAARAVLRQGLPTGLQFVVEVGSFLSLTAIIARMSSADAGAHQLVLHLINVSFLPAHALAEATSVLVGQAVGARREDLVLVVARRALLLAALYGLACMIVFALLGPRIVALMADDAEVAGVATTLLYLGVGFLIADAANVVARGALRGASDVKYAAVVGVVTAWVATPPLALLLGDGLGWGAAGGWLGLSLEIFVGAALFWRRLQRGGWRPAARRAQAELDASSANAPSVG
jgi:MATE family multidrug resistance protein